MILKNISILSFSSLSVRRNADVYIRNGKIEKILDTAPHPPVSDSIIDGKGMYVLPGLTNNHSHTAMTLLRGVAEDVTVDDWFNKFVWIYERSLTPRDVYVGTLLGAAEMLLSGVTAVADHYFNMEQAFDAYNLSGMRANLAWAVFGSGEDSREKYSRALDFTKEYLGKSSRITMSLGPHSPYLCSDDFLKEIVKESEKLNIPMHIHVSETSGQVQDSLKTRGLTPIQVLQKTGVLRKGTILAHAYWATDKDLKLVKESGAGIAHCAKTYMKFGDVNNLLSRALDAGIPVGFGSDGCASNNTMDIFETARDAALLAKCADADPEKGKIDDILPLMTNGSVMGLQNYGEIVPGAPADLVCIKPSTPNMFPGNSIFADILYSLNNRNIDTVIVDGKITVRDGRLVTIDVSSLREEAAEISRRLISTVSDRPMQRYYVSQH